MRREEIILEPSLGRLLEVYADHCRRNGLRESSVQLYRKLALRFLKGLEDAEVTGVADIGPHEVSCACLALKSTYYLSAIHTFLRFLAEEGYTQRDYSCIVPLFKRPQPMPPVYSEAEIRRIEAAVDRQGPHGKRDYAALLLATRLGIRGGDIVTLAFEELDFKRNTICLTQQKTAVPLALPMLPKIKAALLDYLEHERDSSDSEYVFLSLKPPFSHISVHLLGKLTSTAIRSAGIVPGGRKCGPHAFRASLASSMVNDDVPYEAVRNTLGHTDVNAIKSYAKLDVDGSASIRLRCQRRPDISQNSFLAGGRTVERIPQSVSGRTDGFSCDAEKDSGGGILRR